MNPKKENEFNPEKLPSSYPVLPLRDVVVYPYMLFPALVGRESSLRAANVAIEGNQLIFLLPQKDPTIDDPKSEHLYTAGTIAKIVQILKLPNNMIKLLVEGICEADVKSIIDENNFLKAEVDVRKSVAVENDEINAMMRHASSLFSEYVRANKNIAIEVLTAFENIKDYRRKLFFIVGNILQTVEIKQKVLQQNIFREQLLEVVKILTGEIGILKFESELDSKVQDTIQKSQKKFFIQEQIKVLQDELSGDDEVLPEFISIRKQIEKAKLPKNIHEKVLDEFLKLKKTPQLSPEFSVIRNYIDWILSLPWHEKTKDNLDIKRVEKILNEDHFGMEKPKKRILEHIAVLNLVKEMRGQILCLVGPPGVGKTSLAKSIARALGRKFVRMSLGGIRDEAEIRGHRKTYVASMPGRIIQAMKKAGVINPVILLDEVDKMSSDFHGQGDPSAALLEVLDPEQNSQFNDHFLELDYDLSKVMFITTANVQYDIPVPLLDRMELIELQSYLDFDKKEIAKRHIIPKQIKEHGLKNVKFNDDAILKIIREYTRESGVRNLEREVASVLRKAAREIVESKKNKAISVDEKIVEKYLGVPRFQYQKIANKSVVGVITGLAWTSVGGEILEVEVTHLAGREKFILTGKLGTVMKESAQAALTYIRSRMKELKIDTKFFEKREIHIHIPEGATPKDGPSAGITMTMAMISAICGIKPKPNIAMTGEITLRGNVLGIGGLNEKLLAAKRAGIKIVIIPKENEKNLIEISPRIKEGLKIFPVSTIDEAMPLVFEKKNKF